MKKKPSAGSYIALGANLPHPRYGPPEITLQVALSALFKNEIIAVRLSRFYRSAAVPASDQPWYINAVAEVDTELSADEVLKQLHAVEAELGRVRGERNAARLIDLDLLDHRGEIAPEAPGRATLPHPRLAERAFVLKPLADVAPDWRHPVTGSPIRRLLDALPADQVTEVLDPQPEPWPALRFGPKTG